MGLYVFITISPVEFGPFLHCLAHRWHTVAHTHRGYNAADILADKLHFNDNYWFSSAPVRHRDDILAPLAQCSRLRSEMFPQHTDVCQLHSWFTFHVNLIHLLNSDSILMQKSCFCIYRDITCLLPFTPPPFLSVPLHRSLWFALIELFLSLFSLRV